MENSGEVLEDGLGAFLDGSGKDVALLVSRNLAGDEDKAIGLDGLRLCIMVVSDAPVAMTEYGVCVYVLGVGDDERRGRE